MCFGAIINSRIENLYYGCRDDEKGFQLKNNFDFIKKSHLNIIEGNILNFRCNKILSDFFVLKRKKNKKSLK